MDPKNPPAPEAKPEQVPFFARGSKALSVQSGVRAGTEAQVKRSEANTKLDG